jgi:hypothetical protein
MRTIAENAAELRWWRPRLLRPEYELLSQGQLVGTLRFHGFCRSLATAESGEGKWTFHREGFFRTRATIRSAASADVVATFRSSFWGPGGELTFATGRRVWASMNFWSTRLQFHSESNMPLVQLRSGGLSHRSAQVDLASAARDLPDLPLLVLFGWYLFIMFHRDAAAVVVTG